jgi:hypothetical protein
MAEKTKYNIWQFLRDVLVEAMRRGQLPLVVYFFIIILGLYKTPENYFPTLWQKFFELRNSIVAGSLVLNMVLAFGWYFDAKRLRRSFKDENERIIKERNEVQKSIGIPIKSSDKRIK